MTDEMRGQGDLFTDVPVADGEALARVGMAQAEENADPAWLAEAKRIVWQLITSGDEFTTDIVWALLEQRGYTTHEPRALGSTIRAALRNGYMREVRMVKSQRRECHSRRISVYVGTGVKAA